MLGLVDTDDLDLVELMEAIQATYILAIRTSLTTEARRVSRIAYRQVLLIEDHISVDIGHGHFGRRDEVEVI